MGVVVCHSRGVCVATLPSEVAADRSVGFVRSWLFLTLNSELCAKPAEKTLVLRRFTRHAEAPPPVTIDLDAKTFEDWYKQTWKLHRRVPTKQRKDDADLCEYLNGLRRAKHIKRRHFYVRDMVES